MHIAIIGHGAIGRYVLDHAQSAGHTVAALIVRSERVADPGDGLMRIASVDDLPAETDCVLDCAGHSALRQFAPDVLRRGIDVITVSLGALADATLRATLERAAVDGRSRLHLASGAIGALDALRAARVGGLDEVIYTGRKPPLGWAGSPAEDTLDLAALASQGGDPQVHFDGNAGDAATRYPKNANVAAAVALAGIGFEHTRVTLIADPNVAQNIHEVRARGSFGQFHFDIRGLALPDNPRSSALAAMSVVAKLAQQQEPLLIG